MKSKTNSPEWMPISNPPNDTKEYLVAYRFCGSYRYAVGFFDGKSWRNSSTRHKIPTASHWTYLPEEPKGE